MHKLSKKKIKIGILGGTFDPPHIGHLDISKVGIKKLKLNKLMWLITEKNPLKQKPSLSIKKRIKLSEKITRSERKIFVQYLESKIKSKNTYKWKIRTEKNVISSISNLSKYSKWKKSY